MAKIVRSGDYFRLGRHPPIIIDQSSHASDWILKHTNSFVEKCCEGTDGNVSSAAAAKSYRFTTKNTAASLAMTQSKI
jgi:hypothetical protein